MSSPCRLSDAMLRILRFVYGAEASGIKPSPTDIGTELGASKPTVRKTELAFTFFTFFFIIHIYRKSEK